MTNYTAVIYSNSSLGREYTVTTRSSYKVALELGRCELGEVVQIVNKSGEVISETRYSPEIGRGDAGYYRCFCAK